MALDSTTYSTQDTLGSNETIETAYPNDIRIIRVDRADEPPVWRFEAPLFTVKDTDTQPVFESQDDAEMYAAVYVAVNGFREEKTGRRGVPPEVAMHGQQAIIAYCTTQRGMSIQWAADFFGLDRQRVYEYRSRIRREAREIAEQENDNERDE